MTVKNSKVCWSRYNLLFLSERNGWLLYNSASNAFLQLSTEAVEAVERIKENPNAVDYSTMPDLYFHLRNGGFLVGETQDDDFFNILKMRRLTANYAGHVMILTIAQTRACNFACPYCYEGNRTASLMSEETEDKLVEFIKKHKKISTVALTWYGGEPLLAFPHIQRLNSKIEETGKNYVSSMITNGYLLNEEVISQLNTLKIKKIQITLDGKKETHDSRRHLINGGETFDKIVSNIDKLMSSDWEGTLDVRVNVDPSNKDEFAYVYKFIQERYPDKFDKNVIVYPGFVHSEEVNPDTSCFFDSRDKGQFLVDLYREHKINALPAFPHMVTSGCTMTKRNAYVVGPDGELYKCWNDVGEPEEVIGNVSSFLNWNTALVAEGMVGASYLEDPECQKCFFFPICDGGCAKMRMLNKRDGEKRDTCSYFKDHIKTLLELHYEKKNGIE
jgi:uncharacterized protein